MQSHSSIVFVESGGAPAQSARKRTKMRMAVNVHLQQRQILLNSFYTNPKQSSLHKGEPKCSLSTHNSVKSSISLLPYPTRVLSPSAASTAMSCPRLSSHSPTHYALFVCAAYLKSKSAHNAATAPNSQHSPPTPTSPSRRSR